MSDDIEDVRREIDEKYADIEGANFYEILGIGPDADASTISERYRELAKKWHADRFRGYDLSDEYVEKVQEISTALNDAHRTLSNPDDRESYDASLDTDPAEISSVIDAESAFRRGRNLLDAGRNEGAHKHFERAVEMSPEEEPEYEAHLMYTRYLLIPKDREGRPKDRDEAREIFRELDDIADAFSDAKGWMKAYLGAVALGLDRNDEAERLFQETLRLDPDNRLAQRQLRLLNMRKDDDEGFFSKILSKLKLG
jgi:curved DNA-binding protein CbpA